MNTQHLNGRNTRSLRLPILWALAAVLAACAQQPTERIEKLTRKHQTQNFSLTAENYEMKAIATPGLVQRQPTLRVYFEGDGMPWVNNGQMPAQNPSSRTLTGLQLMLADPQPAIYLSRPCYGHNTVPQGCEETLWTSARYSQSNIRRISAALDALKKRYQASHLELLGFSGGGTIATILSAQRDDVIRLVTVAANLDHRRWTEHFGYLPLSESLNARDFLPLPTRIQRWHHIAEEDRRVPYLAVAEALATDTGATAIIHQGFDHSRDWPRAWPTILKAMKMDK